MLEKFQKYIEEENLAGYGDRLLVAVSGGADSVVLADLLDKIGIDFGIAHCNFQLRGEESDGDEFFVRVLAGKYGKPFYRTGFNTREVAAEEGISIEMAARNLRYRWFEQIRVEEGYTAIAVAHHRDDVLETAILNLLRGTGIRGLSGIKNRSGNVIRPLLFASRKAVVQYALTRQLAYREDSSNTDTSIIRNKIRHDIFSLFEQINPSFRKSMATTIRHLNEVEQVFLKETECAREVFCQATDEGVNISIERLKSYQPVSTYLFEALRPYGFNPAVVDEMVAHLNGESGKIYYSHTHRAVKDRNRLIVLRRDEAEKPHYYYIDEGSDQVADPLPLKISVVNRTADFKIPADPMIACIDYDKVSFPLIVRKWEQGEYFRPLGMQGYKKLSDFFIDEKLSIPEKEKTWILSNGKQVVWVIGRRLDDRYKITDTTKKIVIVEKQLAMNSEQ